MRSSKPHCHRGGVWVTLSQENGSELTPRGQAGDAGDKETEYTVTCEVPQPSTKYTTSTHNPVFFLEMPCVHGGGFL